MPEFDFRPLSGNLIFQSTLEELVKDVELNISVPYREILFFNYKNLETLVADDKEISVPYRGILFFNHELHLSCYFLPGRISVPYRGILFFNNQRLLSE